MEDNLKPLDAGPLGGEEMARVRRIGDHIHGRKRAAPLAEDRFEATKVE
ncbi:MAG: hypothetical protein JSW46_13230 [Gemmatimonadota bacterium]|nr:MAG: hypothetical protein JSW46_13230 [Gemmatimonadota bacterium]